jgi:chorismate mutase/prephenate dehydrogenase
MGLHELRTELAEIDRQIIDLVKRRQTLSLEVGKAKRATGRATRDYGQEKQVIERARGFAAAAGVSPELAEKLVLLLIDSSLTVQEQDRVADRGAGTGKRAFVIGGRGKMGGWFVRFLSSQGYDVEVADPSGEVPGFRCYSDWRQATVDHEIVVVAAPLGTSNEVLHELAARKPSGVVFDIGSLKSPLRTGLRALVEAGVAVTSVHPMFGPDTELLSKRHVAFIDLGVPEATVAAEQLFDSTMAIRVRMELEEHDRVMAYVLGLSHALNIAFFTALADSGESAPRLAEISSTTFENQLAVARAVASENPRLYFEIQSRNDYGTESLAALLHAVERLRSVVRASDERGFVSLMERGRDYLSRRSS